MYDIPYDTIILGDKITHTPSGRISKLFFGVTVRVNTPSDMSMEKDLDEINSKTTISVWCALYSYLVGPYGMLQRKSHPRFIPRGEGYYYR